MLEPRARYRYRQASSLGPRFGAGIGNPGGIRAGVVGPRGGAAPEDEGGLSNGGAGFRRRGRQAGGTVGSRRRGQPDAGPQAVADQQAAPCRSTLKRRGATDFGGASAAGYRAPSPARAGGTAAGRAPDHPERVHHHTAAPIRPRSQTGPGDACPATVWVPSGDGSSFAGRGPG